MMILFMCIWRVKCIIGKKNIELFLGHRHICFKSPALLFLLLSKKEKENAFPIS